MYRGDEETPVNAGEYEDWATRAFLYAEAALTQELAFTPAGGGAVAAGSSTAAISEELVRTSFVKGLVHTQPAEAHRIRTEFNAAVSTTCWHDSTHTHPGKGRPLQHDVVVIPGNDRNGTPDAGMYVEVKWLKAQKPEAVARDIWKLLFARGTAAPNIAARVYLLVGGERDAFTGTMDGLRKAGADLRWSNARAGAGGPARRLLSVDKFFAKGAGSAAFDSLLTWESKVSGAKLVHYREPLPCLGSAYITRRVHWQRTVLGTSLRLVLWEITNHGTATDAPIDWVATRGGVPRKC
jgi:hypothetical protein